MKASLAAAPVIPGTVSASKEHLEDVSSGGLRIYDIPVERCSIVVEGVQTFCSNLIISEADELDTDMFQLTNFP